MIIKQTGYCDAYQKLKKNCGMVIYVDMVWLVSYRRLNLIIGQSHARWNSQTLTDQNIKSNTLNIKGKTSNTH